MTLQSHEIFAIAGGGQFVAKLTAASATRQLPFDPLKQRLSIEEVRSVAKSASKELHSKKDEPWTNWVAIVVAMVLTADRPAQLSWKQASVASHAFLHNTLQWTLQSMQILQDVTGRTSLQQCNKYSHLYMTYIVNTV